MKKAFDDYKLGYYAYDGEKNVYTVDSIKLIDSDTEGVSKSIVILILILNF